MPKHKEVSDLVTVLASAAQTAASTGEDAVYLPTQQKAIAFILDVTAAATEAGDLLDVFVQTRMDDGSGETWHDVVHFTQLTGDGGAKQHIEKISASEPQAGYESGTALGAGEVRHLLGDAYRVRWAITDAATTGNLSFTFSVTAMPM